MKLYSENKYYKLFQGNMLDMLDVIEPETIDSIITDPPYGLTSITKRFGNENSAECQYGKDGSFARLSRGFMGKEWDGSGIEYNVDAWRKCYEVLKPGGYLLAFGGSRTFHRIACAIEDAGFEIRDTIMWLYGSGFPKSMDISKQIDKKGGNDYSKQFAKDLKEARESRNLTMKYCDDKYCNGSTNWSWYEGRKYGCRVPDYQTYLEIIKEFPELEKYKELIKEAEREVIGKGKAVFKTASAAFGGKGWGTLCNDYDITIPSTDLAKQWQGWGTALKPSFEPIIVARKPFKGSLVDNVIEYGVGGINIDECRVGNTNADTYDLEKRQISKATGSDNDGHFLDQLHNQEAKHGVTEQGRFPANTILTYDETDFDEVCGGFPNTKSTYNKDSKHETEIHRENADTLKYGYKERIDSSSYNDSGSASRYFYCAKASKKDRDEGLDTFNQEKVNDGRNTPIDNAFQRGETLRKNTHPTVKPTELMQYLVRLVTPNNGIILDPFNGSGSTGKAVMYENKERNKNYKYIGIELTEEYLPIAKARIEYLIENTEETKQDEKINEGQTTIFDFLEEDK